MKLSREKFLAAAIALSAATSACSRDPKVTADGAKRQSADVTSPTDEGGVPAPSLESPTLEGQAVPSPVAEIPAPAQELFPVPPVSPILEGLPMPAALPPIPTQLPQAPPIQIPQGLPKPPTG
jgi:hypothetical protein